MLCSMFGAAACTAIINFEIILNRYCECTTTNVQANIGAVYTIHTTLWFPFSKQLLYANFSKTNHGILVKVMCAKTQLPFYSLIQSMRALFYNSWCACAFMPKFRLLLWSFYWFYWLIHCTALFCSLLKYCENTPNCTMYVYYFSIPLLLYISAERLHLLAFCIDCIDKIHIKL